MHDIARLDPFAPLSPQECPSAQHGAASDWAAVLPVPEDAPRKLPPHSGGKPSAQWLYRDPQGRLLFLVCRFDGADGTKDILPLSFCRHEDGRREWRWKGLPAPRPLYGLDRLAQHPEATILVCEGEKAAEAAAALFPDLVAITSPNGAKAADKADWSPLAGRRVVVWPDHDGEGQAYAADVARLAADMGVEEVAVVNVPESFPAKWDLADPLPDGWTRDDLHGLLTEAQQSLIVGKVTAPTGFHMTKTGLFYVPEDPDKPKIHISGPFQVLAETRNDRGEDWGLLIQWFDNDRRQHRWAMPKQSLAGDGAELRSRLLSGGLHVAPNVQGRQLLVSYLTQVRTDARARSVDAVGWHDDVYVTLGANYGPAKGERILLQGQGVDFDRKGTLQDWKEQVARYAVGNSRLVLALSAAFVGPLLKLVGEDSHGYHFCGESSGGKTTALRVASSALGVPIHTWRTTDNSAEGLARAANDGLLLLDELSQADGRAADAMAYMLGNGQGKGRMQRDGANKPVATWRIVFLSTGEVGMADKIGESGKRAKAGQAVRVIEIPADAGAGHKLFDTLHGFANGDALARHLRQASDNHRGHAIRSFLRQIAAAERKDLCAEILAEKSEWEARHLPPGADGQVTRVAARFALAAAAGQLAADFGILPWPDGEAGNAAAICFRAWLDRRGGIGAAESEAGLQQVRAFIEAHGMSRFTPVGGGVDPENTEAKTINRAGFRRKDGQGNWEYLVMCQAWKDEVCKGLDAKAVAKDLISRNLMIPGSNGKSSRPERIPGFDRMRLYHLSAAILSAGGE